MRTGFTSTITSKFQLTIPKAVWTALYLQRGDQILVWEQNGDMIGQPEKTLAARGILLSRSVIALACALATVTAR